MPKFIDRKIDSYLNGAGDGERVGQNQIIDATMIYMARRGMTKDQAIEYFKEVSEIIDRYSEAFRVSQEQDIWQERMDDELRSILGDDCLPFRERYPEIKSLGYDKPLREKKHPSLKSHKRRKR